jgi:hypothetical protein
MADNASSSFPSLTVLGGTQAGVRFVLEEPVDNVLVGSDPSCRFCIDQPGVSPVHARIWIDDTGITVYDTNSPRGLYVNDERVTSQVRLRNGDVIWLGPPGDEQSVMIQCRFPGKETRTEAAEAESAPTTAAPEATASSGGFATDSETLAIPPTPVSSTPLPPPASLLPPPAPPARNEFEDDISDAAASAPPAPAAATPPPMTTPVPAVQPRGPQPAGTSRMAPARTPAPAGTPTPTRPASLTPVPPRSASLTPVPPRSGSLTPVPRSATRPPARRPGAPAPARAPQSRGGKRTWLVLALGLAALVLLAGIGVGAFSFLRQQRSRAASATPTPLATVTPPAAFAPSTNASPASQPEASPTAQVAASTPVEVIIPVAPSTPSATPTPGKTTPTPAKTATPAKTPARSTPTAAAATAAAESLRLQQQAAQVANLVSQAETAFSAQRFDAAVELYDQALRLDPSNAPASAGRGTAAAAAFSWKRAFAPGRTSIQTAKGGGDSNLQGFESADVKVARAPDYAGLIEFVVSPARVKPGDSYSIRVNLTNDGKKAFRTASATVTLVVNGERSTVPAVPPAGDFSPRQSAALAQLGGSWLPSTRSWTLEVAVSTTRGDTFSNQLSWR